MLLHTVVRQNGPVRVPVRHRCYIFAFDVFDVRLQPISPKVHKFEGS